MLRQTPAAGRISAGQDEFLAVGDNPWTDREGAQRMGLPYVLVGHDPCAHFQSLAQMMRSRRCREDRNPCSAAVLGGLKFHGNPHLRPERSRNGRHIAVTGSRHSIGASGPEPGAIATTMPVTPDERALPSWSFLTESF